MRAAIAVRIGLVVAALLVCAGAQGAISPPPAAGTYRGQTSQGLAVDFHVIDNPAHGHAYIDSFGVVFSMTCQKTRRIVTAGHFFRGFHVDINNDQFSFPFLSFQDYFSWSGTFPTQTRGSGEALRRLAVLTSPRGIERCDSGTVTWTADLVGAPVPIEGHKLDYVIEVTRDAAGRIQIVEGTP